MERATHDKLFTGRKVEHGRSLNRRPVADHTDMITELCEARCTRPRLSSHRVHNQYLTPISAKENLSYGATGRLRSARKRVLGERGGSATPRLESRGRGRGCARGEGGARSTRRILAEITRHRRIRYWFTGTRCIRNPGWILGRPYY